MITLGLMYYMAGSSIYIVIRGQKSMHCGDLISMSKFALIWPILVVMGVYGVLLLGEE